jgi:hypothetical protein
MPAGKPRRKWFSYFGLGAYLVYTYCTCIRRRPLTILRGIRPHWPSFKFWDLRITSFTSGHYFLIMTMRRTLLAAVALVVAFATRAVVSEKDNNYYPPGYSNPNVNHEMYWRDSANVLQDLSSFSKLYVEFHSCAYVLTYHYLSYSTYIALMLHRTVSSNRLFPTFPFTQQQYLQLESVRARLRRNKRRFLLAVVHGIHALFSCKRSLFSLWSLERK